MRSAYPLSTPSTLYAGAPNRAGFIWTLERRNLLIAFYKQGMSSKAIAHYLGAPVNGVRKRIMTLQRQGILQGRHDFYLRRKRVTIGLSDVEWQLIADRYMHKGIPIQRYIEQLIHDDLKQKAKTVKA